MCWARLIFIVAVLSACAYAQSAEELVRQTAEYYQTLDSYQIKGELRAVVPDTGGLTYVADAYTEDAGPRFQPVDRSAPLPAMQRVRWLRTEYPANHGSGVSVPPRSVPFWWARVTQIAHFMKSAKSAGSETLTLDGKPEPCQIVDVDYEQTSSNGTPVRWSTRFWISPSKHLVLKQQFVAGAPPLNWAFTLQSIAVNQPPSDEFLNHANSGTVTNRSQWIGKPAPDFTLADANGNRVALPKLLPHVVLLDFWATYCGPCRAELKMLQGIASEYRERGLEVWPITDDDPAAAQRWMTKFGITQPTLFDPDRTVFRAYGINPIPAMVIIGRDGKVAASFEGIQSERDLRAAIEAALKAKQDELRNR